MIPRSKILIIAGSDSSGGAGIQADIKTVTALGSYAMTAVTAITAQNTTGVNSVVSIHPKEVEKQILFTCKDIKPEAIKIGMLHSSEVIISVIKALRKVKTKKIILDPVMVAKGGFKLINDKAIKTLREKLIRKAYLLTPNIPEAEVLAGIEITSVDDMRRAGECLLRMGARSVLIKGGHLTDDTLTDILLTQSEEKFYSSPRLKTVHTHGTGCTLASAVAAGIAQGLELQIATDRARKYVFEAIRSAPGLGAGHGPLNHAHTISKMAI